MRALGRPLLLGTSRKSVIGLTLGLPPDQREEGTAATVALGIRAGADVVRVHDVRSMALVARLSDASCGRASAQSGRGFGGGARNTASAPPQNSFTPGGVRVAQTREGRLILHYLRQLQRRGGKVKQVDEIDVANVQLPPVTRAPCPLI